MLLTRIADYTIEIRNQYDYLRDQCRDYLISQGDPDFVIEVSEEEIAAEQAQKAAAAETAENVMTLSEISIEDFQKVQLSVAEVKACEPIKKAKKLLKLTLNDGSGRDRTVASGIAAWYKPEDLIGRKVVLVANLKPATLCGVESCGMILAGECDGGIKVLFADDLPAGSQIR